MQIGDCIEVRNFITDEYLLGGKISKITDNPAGYSIDGILFVNPNSSRIRVNKVIIPLFDRCFNECITEDKYKIIKHNNIDNTFDYDFFMWDEIEPEVKEICELLNQIPGIETYSSCSGHGIIAPWVDFYIKDIDKFYDLLDYLKANGYTSKTEKHHEVETDYRFIMGVEGRGTCHLEGLEINSNFSELCDILKKYIRLVYLKRG